MCQKDLKKVRVLNEVKRQVIDFQNRKMQLKLYVAERKWCTKCQATRTAEFPLGVTQKTQYGSGFRSLVIYLRHYQLLPYRRIQELCQEVWRYACSLGTLWNIGESYFSLLEPVETQIKKMFRPHLSLLFSNKF